DPAAHQHPEVPQTRGSEAVRKTHLVNLKRLYRFRLRIDVPPLAFFLKASMAGAPMIFKEIRCNIRLLIQKGQNYSTDLILG
ncbi:MAG: hypothetical protein LDL33_15160, partial [Desulfomonile sp.]|nr:hypothetical protein [Desulfomonile sp.]